MNVYVASSFLNKPEVKETQALLIAAGHTISHDWTPDEAPGVRGSDEWNRYLWQSGRRDYDGIRKSDCIVILNDIRGRDMLTEFGMFLGMGRPIFFVRGDAFLDQFVTVFLHCPGVVVVDTVAAALVDLQRLNDGLHVYSKGEPDCAFCGAFGPVDDPQCDQPCDWKREPVK